MSSSRTYDVFLVHSDSDRERAEYIDSILSRAGLKCIASFKGSLFPPGRYILDNIKNATKSSKVTLVLLTKESRESPWVKFEIVLALEKSQSTGQLCIRLLLQGVERSDEKGLDVGILDDLPHLFIDVGSSDWEKKLVQSVKEPLLTLATLLPAGSLALGQVYSVVIGFYSHVLPCLKEAVKKDKYWVENRTSVKFFILLPDDSKTYAKISDYESRIEHVGKISVTVTPHGGKPRPYWVDLYSISDGAERYFFAAEFPNVLKTMFMFKDITKAELQRQMTRFHLTLKKVLTHSKHSDCQNTYNIIAYSANSTGKPEQSLYNLVLKLIKDELKSGHDDVRAQATILPTDSKIKDATITFCDQVVKDTEIYSKICKTLLKHGLTLYKEETGSKLGDICRGKWKIFIISNEGLEEHFLKFAFSSAWKESIDENRQCVIPVLRGIEKGKVPEFIKDITYLSADEEGYEERLVETMKGKEMTMDSLLPAGDVATGLAWGYVLGYLPIPLLGLSQAKADLTERIRTKLRMISLNAACKCIKRLYITVPQTCNLLSIETKTEENRNADLQIENLGQLEPVKFTSSGAVDRPYQLVMFKMTSKQMLPGELRNICFLAEQATPTITLFNMSKRYGDAGLSQEDLVKQAKYFWELCTKLIADEHIKKKVADVYQGQVFEGTEANIEGLCRFVYCDDESKSVAECLEDEIRRDLSSGVELVSL